jgi:hypothetical protein
MPKITYVEKAFSPASLWIIDKANEIIREYQGQGYDLTLRQLYYQFVARDLIANRQTEYKRLGSIINDARLAGLIDWESIVDRTRGERGNQHWNSPAQILEAAARSYQIDKWEKQSHRLWVFIEKDALSGVIEGICCDLDVPFLSCRGYTSQSTMWSMAMQMRYALDAGQTPIILHLGDHDPSGLDMTRDIVDRLELFVEEPILVERLALNMDQVLKYNPPPNPAKITDSRASKYIDEYGGESWELDALEPSILVGLIRSYVFMYRDVDEWESAVNLEQEHIAVLNNMISQIEEMKDNL